MNPKIIKKSAFTLLGMSFYGDPFHIHGGWDGKNEIGRLWTRFMAYLDAHETEFKAFGEAEVSYEVHIYNQETMQKGHFEVFVGIPLTEEHEEIPVELLLKKLPASEYAIATLKGEAISSDWHSDLQKWLATAGYQQAYPVILQAYDERFKGVDKLAESVLDVYMPVKPAQ